MALPSLKRLSPRHEAIAEWLIANPEKKLGDCARNFGVSQTWLSCIIHSDLFRVYYEGLRNGYIDERILPLRDKLNGLADAAIDKLAELLPEVVDARVAKDVMDSTLGRLGYGLGQGGGARGPTINVNGGQVIVSTLAPEELDEARERYRRMQDGLSRQAEALAPKPSRMFPSVLDDEEFADIEVPVPGLMDLPLVEPAFVETREETSE